MSTFIVANLGDAALTVPTGVVTETGTISTGGFLFVDNATFEPLTLTLETALTPFLVIKDVAGNANTYPITITCSSGIDAGTTFELALAYQYVWLAWNGSSYSVVG